MKRSLALFSMIFIYSINFAQKSSPMENYKKIEVKQFNENAIDLIGQQWMLIAAGSPDTKFNMMTASWGGLGWLWEKPVSFIFVRPQRYTFEFIEKEEFYTITFYTEEYRDVLKVLGSKSGRDFDKMKQSGLTPFKTPNGSVAFKEARIIIECKKSFGAFLKEEDFIDKEIVKSKYPKKDFHKMYVGEIVNIWIKE